MKVTSSGKVVTVVVETVVVETVDVVDVIEVAVDVPVTNVEAEAILAIDLVVIKSDSTTLPSPLLLDAVAELLKTTAVARTVVAAVVEASGMAKLLVKPVESAVVAGAVVVEAGDVE